MNGFADSSNLYSPCRRFFFFFLFFFFSQPPGTFISCCGAVITHRKIPYKCWSPRGELAGPFFFRMFLPLYRRKKKFFNRCVWWVNVWGVKYSDGFRPVSLLSTLEMFPIFIYFGIWWRYRQITAYAWDIFHCFETEKSLFDFKIECGKRFVSSLRARFRCWFFTRSEISRCNRGFVQKCTFCSWLGGAWGWLTWF